MIALDLKDQEFGYITVLSREGSKNGSSSWRCLCRRCGREFITTAKRLRSKDFPQTDCGCAKKEKDADRSGTIIGNVEIVQFKKYAPNGTSRLYLCRCVKCGTEKVRSLWQIKHREFDCRCNKFGHERYVAIGKKAAEKITVDGVQIYVATKETPNAGNSTGYRWVRVLHKSRGDWIFALFHLNGKRYYRGGFRTAEAAYQWALKEHTRALDEAGISNPRNSPAAQTEWRNKNENQ